MIEQARNLFKGNGLNNAITFDQFGEPIKDSLQVWSGSAALGVATANSLGSESVTVGDVDVKDDHWIDSGNVVTTEFGLNSVYGISQVMTVPGEPAPPAAIVMGCALLGAALRRRKR